MIVSLPVAVTNHTCSEADHTPKLYDFFDTYGVFTKTFTKGADILDEDGEEIWTYSLDKPLNIIRLQKFSPTAHNVGDIVFDAGKLYKITEKDVTKGWKTPKQPEEYDGWETDISKFKTWTKRYFRAPKRRKSWRVGDRNYWFEKNCAGNWIWKAYDRTTNGCYAYLTQHIGSHYRTSYSHAHDKRGEKKTWGGGWSIKEPTLVIKSAIARGNYIYYRTWTNAPIQYHVTPDKVHYSYELVKSVKDINGFRYNRQSNCAAAFDNKNYTKGIFTPESGRVTFTFETSAEADTIAIGRVYGRSVSVSAISETGSKIFSVSNYPIENGIADTDIGQSANVILYSEETLPPGTKIEVTIKAGWISVGRILAGRRLRLGFTDTLFDNTFKDFSPREQDQWGNVEYKNGVRVYVHSGTVDLPLKDYDALNRAFMYIGGQEMIINSSDSIDNTPPNSIDIFQSTMFIGRFTSFKQKTRNVGDIMDTVATFSFTAEESV